MLSHNRWLWLFFGGHLCRGLQPTNLFLYFKFFITDSSYVGYVLLGGFVDILEDI